MLWHDKRVNKAWCTLTILFLFLPSAIVALVPVRKGVVSADVCLQASANIMLIFATYLFLKRLFRERRIVCFHCKRSLCESNEVTISFNNTTYRDFCHHLVSRTTSIGNGSVFSPPTSCFVLCCVWETDWMYKGPCRRPRIFLVSQAVANFIAIQIQKFHPQKWLLFLSQRCITNCPARGVFVRTPPFFMPSHLVAIGSPYFRPHRAPQMDNVWLMDSPHLDLVRYVKFFVKMSSKHVIIDTHLFFAFSRREFLRPPGNYRFLVQMHLFSLKRLVFLLECILYKRATLIPEKNGRTFWERHGWPVMVVSRREFLRPPGNYRFLVHMVLFSLKKRVFFLEHILYKRATLIPEKRPHALRASWSTCHGGFMSWILEVSRKWNKNMLSL